MMKRRLFLIVAIALSAVSLAQEHVFTLGLRGGADSWQTNQPVTSAPGAMGGLDIAYTCFGRIGSSVLLGPKIGVNLAFGGSSHLMNNYKEQYTNVDYYQENMDYTITAKIYREHTRQLQLEVPLMLVFELRQGLTIAAGAKYMMPLSGSRSLTIREPYVLTYYPDFEVPVYDEIVTGKLQNPTQLVAPTRLPQHNVLFAAEVGYEWTLPYKQSRVGVHAFIDYGLWNTYSNHPSGQRLVDIAPILNREYPVPDIRTNFPTDTYSVGLNYLAFGVKLTYSIFRDAAPCYPCRVYLY